MVDWGAMSKPTPSGRTLLAMETHRNADPDLLPDYHDSDWWARSLRDYGGTDLAAMEESTYAGESQLGSTSCFTPKVILSSHL